MRAEIVQRVIQYEKGAPTVPTIKYFAIFCSSQFVSLLWVSVLCLFILFFHQNIRMYVKIAIWRYFLALICIWARISVDILIGRKD